MRVVCSESHSNHFPKGELSGGVLVRPFECPERWQYVLDELTRRNMTDIAAPRTLDRESVLGVHSSDFVEFLETAWNQWQAAGFEGEAIPTVFPARRMQQRIPSFIDGKLGYYAMAIETAITRGTWVAACSSAACAQTAQKIISAGETASFALCRPPGHHAGIDLYGGYCFLNNAAIAAQGFLDDGAQRVAVLDVDFHHGNGTQDIFYERDDVLFISLHGDPVHAFPHFLGYEDETGSGAGKGYNVNYPMPPGTPYSHWFAALQQAFVQIEQYKPDVLVVSLGVDTYKEDPISFFKLESEDFTHYGGEIAKLGIPTLFVMEGGYAVKQIGVNTVNVLDGFMNHRKTQ